MTTVNDESGWRLVVDRAGPVVRVWLARPEKRNALDTQTLERRRPRLVVTDVTLSLSLVGWLAIYR